jgi:hypothetical protein
MFSVVRQLGFSCVCALICRWFGVMAPINLRVAHSAWLAPFHPHVNIMEFRGADILWFGFSCSLIILAYWLGVR